MSTASDATDCRLRLQFVPLSIHRQLSPSISLLRYWEKFCGSPARKTACGSLPLRFMGMGLESTVCSAGVSDFASLCQGCSLQLWL
jgi:hypothetical protein